MISWMRKGKSDKDTIIAVANFTPVPRENYRIGVPKKGNYVQILNTDSQQYGGSGVGDVSVVESIAVPTHGRDHAIAITLPPLAVVYYRIKAGNNK